MYALGVLKKYNMKASFDDFSAQTQFTIKQGMPRNSFMNERNSY